MGHHQYSTAAVVDEHRFDDLLYDELQQQLPPDMFQGATQLSNSTTDSRRRAVWQSSRTGQCMVVAGEAYVACFMQHTASCSNRGLAECMHQHSCVCLQANGRPTQFTC